MKLWLRDMMTWVNPVNWLGETWKHESIRRIQALEGHVTDLEIRYASLENSLNYHLSGKDLAHTRPFPPPEED